MDHRANIFQEVFATADNCADMCGKSCTYLYQGLSYRDTDWFTVTSDASGTASGTCEAEFPLQFILIYVADCNNLQYLLQQAQCATPITLTYPTYEGQEIWWWVGASVFTGVPESIYALHVCGITGIVPPVPVEESSWGVIKNAYKEPLRK